jgi:hypothetical protein
MKVHISSYISPDHVESAGKFTLISKTETAWLQRVKHAKGQRLNRSLLLTMRKQGRWPVFVYCVYLYAGHGSDISRSASSVIHCKEGCDLVCIRPSSALLIIMPYGGRVRCALNHLHLMGLLAKLHNARVGLGRAVREMRLLDDARRIEPQRWQ